MQKYSPNGPCPKEKIFQKKQNQILSFQNLFILAKYHMFWLSHECFSILCIAFSLKSVISSHNSYGKWINNFYWWDIIKIIISVGKEKVQFTLTSYLKQNKEVQLDLQHFEIFIFSSLLQSLPSGKVLEEKLTYRFLQFGICMVWYFPGF